MTNEVAMNPRQLLVLVVAAAVLGGLACWSMRSGRNAPPADIGKPVLPGLDLARVARVDVAKPGADIAVVQGADGWVVTNLFNYPADVGKLRANLLKLHDLRVADVSRNAAAVSGDVARVELRDAGGRVLADLRLGAPYKRGGGGERDQWRGPSGRHVAPAGSRQAWVVKETLDEFDGDAKSWADTQILAVPGADIESVEMAAPTGSVVALVRTNGSLQIAGLSTNEEFETSKSYGIESALSYLNFSGVADPALPDVQTGLATPAVYRVRLKNGDAYAARIGATATNSTDRYARFSAELAAPGTNATQKAEYEKRKAELDQKLGRWTYLITSYTAENMTNTRAGLVKPKAPATNEVASVTTTNAPAASP